jgi:hypothetical protein
LATLSEVSICLRELGAKGRLNLPGEAKGTGFL